MAQFKYVAQTTTGKTVRGKMMATDEAEVQNKLHEQELFLKTVKEITKKKHVKQLKPKALAEFSRQLSNLLEAGVTLVRAISIIANGESIRPKEKQVYQEILRQLRQGIALSDVMESMNGVFPPLMIYMYRSAEKSGNLDKVAMQMAIHYEKSHKLNSKISSSLTYPKVLSVMIVGVLVVMVKFILPKFMLLFQEMSALPASTRLLLGISDLVEHHWLAILIAVVGAFVVVRMAMTVPKIRMLWHKVLLKVPLFGKLNMTVCTSRFARTLSSLYSAGIPIVSALQIARKTIGNDYIDSQFDQVIPFVRAGNNLSDGIDMIDGIVRKLSDSIRVGEETGKLDGMLNSTADSMEYDADIAISKMVTYIEPIMMIVMGIVVAFVLVSVFSALMGSYNSLAGIS